MSSSTPFFPARSWDTVVTPSCSPRDGDVRGSSSRCAPPSLSPAPPCDLSVLLSVPRGYLQPQPLFPARKSPLPMCPVPQSCPQRPQIQPQCSPVSPRTHRSSCNASQCPQHPQVQPQYLPGPCFQGTQQCNSLVASSTPKSNHGAPQHPKSHPNTSHWYHPSNHSPTHQIRPPVLPSTQTPIPSVPQHPQFPPPVPPRSSNSSLPCPTLPVLLPTSHSMPSPTPGPPQDPGVPRPPMRVKAAFQGRHPGVSTSARYAPRSR